MSKYRDVSFDELVWLFCLISVVATAQGSSCEETSSLGLDPVELLLAAIGELLAGVVVLAIIPLPPVILETLLLMIFARTTGNPVLLTSKLLEFSLFVVLLTRDGD